MKPTCLTLLFAAVLPLSLAACSSFPHSDQQPAGTANVGSTIIGDETLSGSGGSGSSASKGNTDSSGTETR